MSRYIELFAEISEILESEDYEPERFQEMCYELAKEVDVVREVVRACAAGPWRYDVENITCTEWYVVEMEGYEWDYGCIGGMDLIHLTEHIVRFAVLNLLPPETPNHA